MWVAATGAPALHNDRMIAVEALPAIQGAPPYVLHLLLLVTGEVYPQI